jgi:microcystin-dependent protein
MSEAYIGELRLMAFNFAPRNWARCEGQLLPINQNQALFALLGTQYGGNGQTTFGLPDLRGRAAVGMGTGPGLPAVQIGDRGGAETVTLSTAQVPAHQHVLNASSDLANASVPGLALPAAKSRTSLAMFAASGSANTTLNPGAVGSAGGNQAHSNLQPLTVLSYCISLFGIFPSRS